MHTVMDAHHHQSPTHTQALATNTAVCLHVEVLADGKNVFLCLRCKLTGGRQDEHLHTVGRFRGYVMVYMHHCTSVAYILIITRTRER